MKRYLLILGIMLVTLLHAQKNTGTSVETSVTQHLLWHPQRSLLYTNKSVLLQVSANKKTKIDKIEIAIDGQPSLQLELQNSKWKREWVPSREGRYVLTATAYQTGAKVASSAEFVVIYDVTPPYATAVFTPKSLTIGMVNIEIAPKDKSSEIDTQVSPLVFLHIKDKEYPFTVTNFTQNICEAHILITEAHAAGQGTIYIRGLQDRSGNRCPQTSLGTLYIDAGTEKMNWPVSFGVQEPQILAAYNSRFSRNCSGIWIVAQSQQQVTAIEDGEVVEVAVAHNCPGYLRIRRFRNTGVWGYHHLLPGKNPTTGNFWAPGDIVNAQDVLGTVARCGSGESYLYLELTAWQDDQWQNLDSPRAYLHPKAQVVENAQLLLACRHRYPAPNLDFTRFFPENTMQGFDYRFTDLVMIVYGLLAIVTIIVVLRWSRNRYQIITMSRK